MIRVMIVAKYSEVREGLCMVLRLVGNIAVTGAVASLEDAVSQAHEANLDVALVDLEMPEGHAIIRQLKTLNPQMQSIALTSHDYPSARESAAQAGAALVLVKGLDVSEMVTAIETLVGQKKHLST